MSLLNYSTTIKAAKTVSEVTQILVRAGARQIMSEFDDNGQAVGISFSIELADGVRGFSLPINAQPVEQILRNDKNVPARMKTTEHATNVAWRITKDWLAAQMALVATEMVTFDQIMLPYMRSVDGGTFYDAYRRGIGTQAALGAPSSRIA
jgi:hypothetical protein